MPDLYSELQGLKKIGGTDLYGIATYYKNQENENPIFMRSLCFLVCFLGFSALSLAQPVPRPKPPPPAPAPAPPPPAPASRPSPAPPPPAPPPATTTSVRVNNVSPVILPKIDNLISYQEINTVSGGPVEVSEKVKGWLATYYPDPSAVIQSASPEKIVGKAIFPIQVEDGVHTYPEKIHYGFEIAFKPGKYRFTLRYFYLENAHHHDPAEKVYTFYLDHFRAHGGLANENILNHQRFGQLLEHVKLWANSLKNSLNSSNSSDW